MKKIIYTFSFVALFAVCSNAQTDKAAVKEEPAKQDAAKQDPAKKETGKSETGAKSNFTPNAETEAAPAEKDPKKVTRMAINEKGVPASRGAKEPKKEEKAANPGQPASTEKK